MATALPSSASASATAASCLLHLSRRGLPGASPVLSPPRTATFRWRGGCNVACPCSPGPPPAVPAGPRGDDVAGHATSPVATVRIVAVVGEGSISPIKDTPWEEVMRHMADRLKWVDEGFEMLVFTDNLIDHDNLRKELLSQCDMLLNVAITNQDAVQWLINNSKHISNVICFQSSPSLVNKLGGTYVQYTGEQDMFGKLANIGKPSGVKESAEVLKTISNAWERHNSDDIRFCLLVVINAYIRPVSMLKNLRAKGLSTLSCMIKNCGPQILNCLFDPNCRKALQCLNSCSPTDQVCNYRCIVSYESPYLEAFSLCVLQKNNCLDLNAEIPSKPNVMPLTMFREQKLSHEIAEDLFVGWLDSMEWSWRVAAGQNPAYDQFPCQYQLFYRGKAKGSFWYEPVFQVKTLEGELVWRRRRYRVRRASTPGTFYFSVLDNGVISKEFWTIVDVAEDFSWGLFHYHGAAQAAGLSYTGAVLVTPDGSYPDVEDPRLASALEKCAIKKWELYTVDNCSCMGAPLGTPEGSKLHHQISPGKETSILQRR
ncbi:violaxanthin de-epoxidase, chloroplastic-like [Miscanthus floridulus]|uniref:violaxanthin de-epoxidase, chloroplastic-like n=1 Tax=Miscanthus floridulus TaxID=154761 RepID=UPI003457D64C